MSDRDLRLLQRQWTERGTVEAEAALLRGRLRAGTVSRETLLDAARLGHAAAVEVLEEEAPEVAEDLEAWLTLDVCRSAQAATRALVAMAHHVPSAAGVGLLRAAEGWLVCPCVRCAEVASVALRRAEVFDVDAEGRYTYPTVDLVEDRLRALVAGYACLTLRTETEYQWGANARFGSRIAARYGEGEAAVRQAVSQALIPWVLGGGG